MSSKPDNRYSWISLAVVIAFFVGYRTLTGSSFTRDILQQLNPSNSSLQNTSNSPQDSSVSPQFTQKTQVQQPTLIDLKQKAIGFLAQTICSARRYNYTREQSAQKIDFFIEAKNAESIRDWMQEPKVIGAASTLSMAFNENCTSVNMQSEYAQRSLQEMKDLGI